MIQYFLQSKVSLIYFIGISIIVYILLTSRYRERINEDKKKRKFEAWLSGRGVYDREMFYRDIQEFNISPVVAQMAVDLLNTDLRFAEGVIYPKLDEELYAVWGIDEEVEDIINVIFEKLNKAKRVNWNDSTILKLGTIKDLLLYLDDEVFGFQSKK